MKPIDPQSTINPKPKKVVTTGSPRQAKDVRFIDGKLTIVEVIGGKVVKVVGEKKNPYTDIIKQSQDVQKDESITTPLTPLPNSGHISTLSIVETDTKTNVETDETVNIRSGQDALDISVLTGIPKVETGVADTKKDTIEDTVHIEESVPKEEVAKDEPISRTNIVSSQAFLGGAGNNINYTINHPTTEKKDIKGVNIQEPIEQNIPKRATERERAEKLAIERDKKLADPIKYWKEEEEKKAIKDAHIQELKLEAKPEVIKETIKKKEYVKKEEDIKIKEDVKTQPVIPVNIGNLAEKLGPKTIDLTKRTIENTKLNKDTVKEVKHMGDENQREIDEELIAKGVEKKLKDMNFKKSIDDAVKFAGESRTKLTDLHTEFGNIEEKVGSIGKSVGEMCDGVDCIKKDFKSAQERQEEFEKQVQNGIQSLAEKVQKLEDPSYVCDNCGEDAIKALSSYCPNCGNPIPQWTGEDGHSVQGWKPYWLRLKEARTP